MTRLRCLGTGLVAGLLVGCSHSPPPVRDTTAAEIGGDTALAPPPLTTHPPVSPDTGLYLIVEFDGRGTEISIVTPDQRTVVDSALSLGPATPAPEQPDTNSEVGYCDCPEGRLEVTRVPPGIAWLQVRAIEDGEITIVGLQAASRRTVHSKMWRGPYVVLRKGEIRRWRLQVPTSAHPESLTVVPEGSP